MWTARQPLLRVRTVGFIAAARVDFVDIGSTYHNMCPLALEQKLVKAKKAGILPKVVVPVHFRPAMRHGKIRALSHQYGFKVIEDASHAIGAKYSATGQSSDFEPVGNCHYSDITVFSFHPVKIITTAEGGMALPKTHTWRIVCSVSVANGITSDETEMQSRPPMIWNYQQIGLGYNYHRYSGGAGCQSDGAPEILLRSVTASLIATMPGWVADPTTVGRVRSYSSYRLHPIRVKPSVSGLSQRQLYDALQAAEINVNLHYIPVYRQPYYEAMGSRPDTARGRGLFQAGIEYSDVSDTHRGRASQVIQVLTEAFANLPP